MVCREGGGCRTLRHPQGPNGRFAIAGVSLVEVLVVTAIFAVLLAVGAPALNGMTQALRIKQTTNLLFTDMMLAKGEAIKRNSRVAICKSSDGFACNSDGGWEYGWIVFLDINNSGARELNEEVVHSVAIEKPSVAISGNGNVNRYISFSGVGSTKLISGAFQAGTFMVCPLGGSDLEPRKVIINNTGKIRVAKASASACN